MLMTVIGVKMILANVRKVHQSILDRVIILLLVIEHVLVHRVQDWEVDLELISLVVEIFWHIFFNGAHVAIYVICKVVIDKLADGLER